ncbi:MAG: DegT/DnrJ/EryC1/StrS family aminotransferase, partial [Candidatus Geothermarchaeales archaeon]
CMIHINEPILGEEEFTAVRDVLASGRLTSWSGGGPMVRRFEEGFAGYVGVREAVAVNSGTAALHSALSACGIGEGDEVIVPTFTFAATANTVLLCGAKPVFTDIDGRSFNIDPEHVEGIVTPRTRAIVPVHVFGQPAAMRSVLGLAEAHGLAVIEDAAQAHGALLGGRKVGSLGRAGCFSFYGSKNISTGEGGMITTDDEVLAGRARRFRSQGQADPHSVEELGYSYRMPEVEAALGWVQLGRLDGFLEKRNGNAAYLTERLRGVEGVDVPFVMTGVRHAFYVYTITVSQEQYGMTRDELQVRLREAGVEAAVYWSVPVHLMPLYRRLLNSKEGDLPVAEEVAGRVLSLPVHPRLSEEDLDIIAGVVAG